MSPKADNSGRKKRRRPRASTSDIGASSPDRSRPSAATRKYRDALLWPAAVFLVALVLRLLALTQLRQAPFWDLLFGDGAQYDEWARRIAAGDWIGSGVFYQSPLYPYFLGALYATVGRSLTVVRVIQCVGDSVACALTAVTTERLFGRTSGLVAGGLMAFYGPSVFFDAVIQKSALDLLLVALLAFSALGSVEPLSVRRAFICGIVTGLLALNRENSILLIPIIVSWCSARAARRRAALLAVACGVTVILLPVVLRNATVRHEFHLTTSQFGPNLFIGNNDRANGTYVPLRKGHGNAEFEQRDATELAEEALGHRLTAGEVSAYWRDRALDWIRQHPQRSVQLVARKALLLINGTEAADTEDPYTYAESSSVLKLTLAVVTFGVLAPLAVLGVFVTRSEWRKNWLVYIWGLVYLGGMLPFYVLDRYRYPVVPLLAILAGAGMGGLRRWWTASAMNPKVAAVAVVGVTVAACGWPIQSTSQMRALTNNNVGLALQTEGRRDEAIIYYRRATDLFPAFADAHSNLGAALAAGGDHEAALEQYQTAARLDPDLVEPHVNSGIEFAQQGRYDEALRSLDHARALDPSDVSAHYNLGLVLAAVGQSDKARQSFETALRLDPENADAHNNLGVLLAQAGDLTSAIEHFRAALTIRPDDKGAAANLARAEAEAKSR
ncbi:MAG TPA: tetratricopeptide repeat protein [Vicinamibacterales bacterium]